MPPSRGLDLQLTITRLPSDRRRWDGLTSSAAANGVPIAVCRCPSVIRAPPVLVTCPSQLRDGLSSTAGHMSPYVSPRLRCWPHVAGSQRSTRSCNDTVRPNAMTDSVSGAGRPASHSELLYRHTRCRVPAALSTPAALSHTPSDHRCITMHRIGITDAMACTRSPIWPRVMPF